CDLIIAADDARFSNPVARMSGVGVELLVEPWELGARKAKEFMLCATTLTAEEAERYGLVNRVVARDAQGQRDSWRFHFVVHQFVSNTPTALDRAAARKEGGMDAVKREQQG